MLLSWKQTQTRAGLRWSVATWGGGQGSVGSTGERASGATSYPLAPIARGEPGPAAGSLAGVLASSSAGD